MNYEKIKELAGRGLVSINDLDAQLRQKNITGTQYNELYLIVKLTNTRKIRSDKGKAKKPLLIYK